MVRSIKGLLVECNASVKQIIMKHNREENCVIHDIDDNTIFIDQKYLKKIEEDVECVINSIVKKNFD